MMGFGRSYHERHSSTFSFDHIDQTRAELRTGWNELHDALSRQEGSLIVHLLGVAISSRGVSIWLSVGEGLAKPYLCVAQHARKYYHYYCCVQHGSLRSILTTSDSTRLSSLMKPPETDWPALRVWAVFVVHRFPARRSETRRTPSSFSQAIGSHNC